MVNFFFFFCFFFFFYIFLFLFFFLLQKELALEYAINCLLDPIEVNFDKRREALNILIDQYDLDQETLKKLVEKIRKEGISISKAMSVRKDYLESNKFYNNSTFAVKKNFIFNFLFLFFI